VFPPAHTNTYGTVTRARNFGFSFVRAYRLAYNPGIAAGQLAVLQGASEAPISELIRVERATRKNGQLDAAHKGCVENGPAAALLVGYVSI